MDVTEWLAWFLDTLHRAVDQAQHTLDAVLDKARFWQRWATTPLNERQVKLLNKLLDGFDGKLTSSKWAAIAKCSPDTALRDINDLLALGVLRKSDAGGRSTSYVLDEHPTGSEHEKPDNRGIESPQSASADLSSRLLKINGLALGRAG
jgi:Fic family protein